MTSPKQNRFKIVGKKSGYSPESKYEPNFICLENSTELLERIVSDHKLYIKDAARQTIYKHIGWGKKTKYNIVEQGGLLLGYVYYDKRQDLTYGVVERAVAGVNGEGNAVYLKLSNETWTQMLTEKDAINESRQGEDLKVIGWYHTHPNSLDVFMSGTDRNTQANLFSKNWHFAIVINPHKLIWRAFWGRDATPCPGYFVKDIEEVDFIDTDDSNKDVTINAKNKQLGTVIEDQHSTTEKMNVDTDQAPYLEQPIKDIDDNRVPTPQSSDIKKKSINLVLVWLLLLLLGFTLGYYFNKIF